MSKFRFLLLALILTLAMKVSAQEDIRFAAVEDGTLTLHGFSPTPISVSNPPARGISNLAWSPDGSKLAYVLYDENFQSHLMVTDASGGDPVTLETGALEAGFPLTFTPEGDLLYVEQGTFSTDPDAPYMVQVKQIRPEAGAAAETVGSFGNLIGCGGGSIYPADWRYWEEAGFGGNALVLQMTPAGLVHSASCGGETTGLLNLQTGQDTSLVQLQLSAEPTPQVGRLKLSPDGTTLAGIKQVYDDSGITRSLVTIDLAGKQLTDVPTVGEPEQVAWAADGTLYYSTQTLSGNLLDGLTLEERAKINEWFGGEVPDVPTYTVSIHHLNLSTGEDTEVYNADAYTIGRMAVAEDGTLMFSQIANMGDWVKAVAAGTIDQASEDATNQQMALVPISLFRLDTATEEATLVGENLAQFALQP
jgi:hypothetical protein